MQTVASLMIAADAGDEPAADRLFGSLYAELHRMARRELARRGGATLGATTLLHEAYLEIASRSGSAFPDRARFMGYAARVMRGLIVDHARRRRAIKRGGQFEITSLGTEAAEQNAVDARELARISDALDELASTDRSLAEIVDLRFFCGFSFTEIAAMRGSSERTVQRQWDKARIYLHRCLGAPALA
jgi:RNA polymerase sigma factor (TIGR02999 family)